MIWVALMRLDHGHDGITGDKAGDIVHMSVRVVPLDAISQPEDLPDAEVVAQSLLDLLTGHSGIAVRIEQAGGSCQEAPCPVRIDRATLQDEGRLKERHPEMTGNPCGNHIISIIGRVFAAPRVVPEIIHSESGRSGTFHKNRPMITAPRLVGGIVMELDPLHGRGLGEKPPQLSFLFGRRDIDPQDFRFGDHCRHFHQGRHDTIIAVREALTVPVGPGDPGSLVRFPLRGHGIAERARRGGWFRHNRKDDAKSPGLLQRLELPEEGRLGGKAGAPIDESAILENHQRGDRGDAVGTGDTSGIIDVHLGHDDLASELLAEFLDHRGNHPARTTPGGPKVDEQGRRGGDRLVEIGIV